MSENALTRESLLQQIESSWNEFQTYIASLTEDQLTGPTDAAGWTAKDHLIHLAAWESAALGVLNGTPKRETLEITSEVWEQDDDPINAVLQERYRDMPLNEVMQTLRRNRQQMLDKLDTMTEADLMLPYRHYQPQSKSEDPIIEMVMGDTVYHYQDHKPWIAAIVGKN